MYFIRTSRSCRAYRLADWQAWRLEQYDRFLRAPDAQYGQIRAGTLAAAVVVLAGHGGALWTVLSRRGLCMVDSNARWNFFEIATALVRSLVVVVPTEDFVYDQRMLDSGSASPRSRRDCGLALTRCSTTIALCPLNIASTSHSARRNATTARSIPRPVMPRRWAATWTLLQELDQHGATRAENHLLRRWHLTYCRHVDAPRFLNPAATLPMDNRM